MSFAELGLSEALVRAVAERGYDTPTPIQARAIPAVLGGGDLLAGAQTGTGKTAGFVLPLLQRLSTQPALHPAPAPRTAQSQASRAATHPAPRPIRALILTPTRELAAQVEESVVAYGKYTALKSAVVFGGVNINPQIDRLRRGVDILVATPGRLLDHVGQRTVDLSRVEVLVLDEADRMLDMGFIHDIRRVLKLLPARRQNLLFSATFSDEIRALADSLLDRPAMIEVARRNAPAESVAQRVLPVDRARKRELLSHMIRESNWYQVLVFTRTKHGANRLAEQLVKDGIPSLAIHGNKSQNARTRALAEFKSGTLQALVATDIAARGLDIVDLPHVVNFDLPNVSEDYVHRIGRTGRAGAEGEAISLVSPDENGLLRDIERLLRREIPRETIAGFALDPHARNEPEVDDRSPRPSRRPARAAPSGAPQRRGRYDGHPPSNARAPGAAPHAAPGRGSAHGSAHGGVHGNAHGTGHGAGAPSGAPRSATALAGRGAAPSRPAGVGGFRGRPSQRGR